MKFSQHLLEFKNIEGEIDNKNHFINFFYLSIYLIISTVTASAQTKFTIYFDLNKSELKQPSIHLLDSVSEILKTKTDFKISINGYCDISGDEKSNQILSKKRASVVSDYFKNRKLPPQFITEKGLSVANPIASNDDENGKAKNRRVEIQLTILEIASVQVQKEVKVGLTPTITTPVIPLNTTSVIPSIKTSVSPSKTAPVKKRETMDANIKVEDLEIGKIFILKNINFVDGTVTILPESKPTLKALLKLLKENSTLEIEIEGHVCCRNDMELSTDRALTILEYLVNNGIDEKRLKYAGHGYNNPISDEHTEEGRKQNRRVEIMILKL